MKVLKTSNGYYPKYHRGQVQRIRVRSRDICHKCGSHAGLLLITLPSNVYNRPRTAVEAENIAVMANSGLLSQGVLDADRKRRAIRLCPTCIKPMAIKNGGRPVNEWTRGVI